MSDPAKFLKISFRVWWFIFLGLQIFLLVLMIGNLGAQKWVYSNINTIVIADPEWSDTDNNLYQGYKFEGTLSYCTGSCNTDWGTLARKWCDYWDDLKNVTNPTVYQTLYNNEVQSVCYMYFALFIGMNVYAAFEIIALILVCKWAVAMFLYWKKVKIALTLSFVCAGCVWFCHYLALIFYMVFTKANFNGDCVNFNSDGTNPKLCASQGPGLSLFIAIILPFIVTLYCIVACNLKNKHGPEGLQKGTEESAPPDGNKGGENNIEHTQYYPSLPAEKDKV